MKIIMGSHLTNAANLSNDSDPALGSAGSITSSRREMVIGTRIFSPINLSVLTVVCVTWEWPDEHRKSHEDLWLAVSQ